MMRLFALSFAMGLTLMLAHNASAAVSYSTAGDIYLQNFNNPIFPANSNPLNIIPGSDPPQGVAVQYNGSAHIQNGNTPWPGGWKDDYTRDETYLGVPGWYLHHDLTSGTEVLDEEGNIKWFTTGGANGHAQVRYGGGNAASGTGFFVFANTNCPSCGEKALGVRSAGGFGRMYIGLQLINDTEETLNSFTITYDAEQYSEAASPDQDGFDLQWSLSATGDGWRNSNSADPQPGDFYFGENEVERGAFESYRSQFNNNPASNTPTNDPTFGSCLNCLPDISHTVSGISWAPGTELWIRWRDVNTVHDGIAIDNVRFTASAGGSAGAGDHNGDGVIDMLDYVVWRADPNGNNGDEGYEAWAASYGEGMGAGASASSGAVPEPTTAGLILVGLGVLAACRRRQAESLL